MEKIINLNLGVIRGGPQQAVFDPPEVIYMAGWYIDVRTGAIVYYDPTADKFLTPQGTVYVPLGYMNPAPKQVTLASGDSLKIKLGFKYMGPAVIGVTGYNVIGVYGVGFAEQIMKTQTFNIPENKTTTPIDVSNEATILIPTNIDPSWNDIYVKMYGGTPSIGGAATTPYITGYIDALVIVGIAPVITGFQITDFSKV